jgi:hypothetical protein
MDFWHADSSAVRGRLARRQWRHLAPEGPLELLRRTRRSMPAAILKVALLLDVAYPGSGLCVRTDSFSEEG